MAYEHILLDERDGVATLTINRPSVLNALSYAALEEMMQALTGVVQTGTTRALVLTGAGRGFCSGADLTGNPNSEGPPDAGAGLESHFNPLLLQLRDLPIPFITAVNGVAAGGGCGFALAGDLVVAGKSAYFLQPFGNIGLVPDVGATWLLPRLIGKARAAEMMLLGERVPAQKALDWGMIYQVVEDAELATAAHALAARLAAGPTVTYGLMRKGIAACLELDLEGALQLERDHQRLAGRTADHIEGVRAFREKRKPEFKGK